MRRVIYIFIGGILIVICLTIIILNSDNNPIKKDMGINKFTIKSNDILFDSNSNSGPKIKVYITKDKKNIEMFLEEYVIGVVAGEMPAEFSMEALKSQAVVARTYALSHMDKYGDKKCDKGKDSDICDTVHCQVYMSKEERLNAWSSKTRYEMWNKITQAVMSTEEQVLTFNGKLVLEPLYFSTSSGRTENAIDVFNIDVPYLKSVESKGEEISPSFKSTKKITYSELVKKLNSNYPKAGITTSKIKKQIKILNRYEGGSVKDIRLGNITILGVKFRNILGLDSDNFTLEFNSKNVTIDCKGYGHNVGMSQWGANIMGTSGKTYNEILTHYYNGVNVEKMKY